MTNKNNVNNSQNTQEATQNTNNISGRHYKNLLEYITLHQAGDEMALYDLISTIKVKERNADGGTDNVQSLHFADVALSRIYWDLKMKYYAINRTDLDSWLMSCLVGDDGKGILSQAKTHFEPKQLISWIAKRLDGHIKNCIQKESTFGKKDDGIDVIGSTYKDENGEEVSHLDSYSFQQWDELQDLEDSYSQYLTHLGGLNGIDVLLTDSPGQLEIWHLYKSGLSQESIGELLKCTQSNVSQQLTAARNKLKANYLNWKMMKLITKKNGNDNPLLIAKEYLNQIDVILTYDLENSFDFYSYTKNFLLKNINVNNMEDDFERLATNKDDSCDSFYDVLMSNAKPSSYQHIGNLLKGVELTVKRDKNRLVNAIIYSMNSIVKESEMAIKKFNNLVVEKATSPDKMSDIGKLITG